MNTLTRVVLILLLLIIVGGTAALAMWDIPAPSRKIEKVIPDDRFQR
jgi:hypothetical protein